MGALDVVVVLVAAGLIAALGWFFFGPRRAGAARVEGGTQRALGSWCTTPTHITTHDTEPNG